MIDILLSTHNSVFCEVEIIPVTVVVDGFDWRTRFRKISISFYNMYEYESSTTNLTKTGFVDDSGELWA
jgi:hypothetical protein